MESLYPNGFARGITNVLTLSGKFEPWPCKVWTSEPGLRFEPQTNKGKFDVTVEADAKPGPRLLRLYNDDGASESRIVVIEAHESVLDTEPNNHFAKPQWITNFPMTVRGKLNKRGDVDSFAVTLKEGEWLDARVESYTMMCGLDAVLRLVLTNGWQLAHNHDWATFDPRLTWRAPSNQVVVVQMFGFPYPANSEVALAGGDAAVYRLHLNVSNALPAEMQLAMNEHEPNNSITNTIEATLPLSIAGEIGQAGDEERYRVILKKDEHIEASIEAEAFGSPLDAWIKFEDATGKELAKNDDADASRDPRLEWKAPADSTNFVVVGSLVRKGGSDYRYRLKIEKALADYKPESEATFFTLAPGATNSVKLKLGRLRDFTNEVEFAFHGLPTGVSAAPVKIDGKTKEATLALIAATNAPPFNGPVQIVATNLPSLETRKVRAYFTSRGEYNGVPQGYRQLLIESSDQLWLTVKPLPPPPSAVVVTNTAK